MATKSTNLRFREVDVNGEILMVPSGIARNRIKNCWQVKVEKNGVVALKGNYADSAYGGPKSALRVATRELLTALERVEQEHQTKKPSEIDTVQVTLRSSLMWFPSMGSLKLRLNVYDRSIKKNHALYIGTGKTLISKPDQTVEKLAMGLWLDSWLEDGRTYEGFRSECSPYPGCIPEQIMEMAKQVYSEHVITYRNLQE